MHSVSLSLVFQKNDVETKEGDVPASAVLQVAAAMMIIKEGDDDGAVLSKLVICPK